MQGSETLEILKATHLRLDFRLGNRSRDGFLDSAAGVSSSNIYE